MNVRQEYVPQLWSSVFLFKFKNMHIPMPIMNKPTGLFHTALLTKQNTDSFIPIVFLHSRCTDLLRSKSHSWRNLLAHERYYHGHFVACGLDPL